MTEMTPDDWINEICDLLHAGKTNEAVDTAHSAIIAAVQAEHERIARAHDQRALEIETLDAIMNKGQDVTHSPEANWHRQQAAAIRAMPEQGAERD